MPHDRSDHQRDEQQRAEPEAVERDANQRAEERVVAQPVSDTRCRAFDLRKNSSETLDIICPYVVYYKKSTRI